MGITSILTIRIPNSYFFYIISNLFEKINGKIEYKKQFYKLAYNFSNKYAIF